MWLADCLAHLILLDDLQWNWECLPNIIVDLDEGGNGSGHQSGCGLQWCFWQERSNVTAKAFSSTLERLLNWIWWMDGYVKRLFSFNWNKNTNPFGQRNYKKWYAVLANPPTAKFKYLYTGIIINFSLYGQICEPSKCQEALVKMLQLGCVFVSVVVHVLNMNLKSCSRQTSPDKINTEN